MDLAATCCALFLGHVVCYSMVYFQWKPLVFSLGSLARDQTLPSSHISVDIELQNTKVAFSGQPCVHQTLDLYLYIYIDIILKLYIYICIYITLRLYLYILH